MHRPKLKNIYSKRRTEDIWSNKGCEAQCQDRYCLTSFQAMFFDENTLYTFGDNLKKIKNNLHRRFETVSHQLAYYSKLKLLGVE